MFNAGSRLRLLPALYAMRVTDASRTHDIRDAGVNVAVRVCVGHGWAIVNVTDAWNDGDMNQPRHGRKTQCGWCRERFKPVKPWQKHCSERCRKMAYAHTDTGRELARDRARRYRRRLRRKRVTK